MASSHIMKADAKADRFLKIKLPTELYSGTSSLIPTKVSNLSPTPKQKDKGSATKKKFPLPHLSLTIEKPISSINNSFKPSPKRPSSRFYRGLRPKYPKPLGTAGSNRGDALISRGEVFFSRLRSSLNASVAELLDSRVSPVVSVRTSSPLVKLRHIVPIKGRKGWAMFEAMQYMSDIPSKLQKVAMLNDI